MAVRCRSPSARRRSGTSTTSRCACSTELREADVVLCEDTRHTRGAARPPRDRGARSSPTTSTTRPSAIAELLPRLAGRRADRARLRCRAARDLRSRARGSCGRRSTPGVPVTVLPGPSAVETALVASGLVGERYRFVGFLPRGAGGARGALGGARARGRWPVVAFESPQRLPARRCARSRRPTPERDGRRVPRADEALRGGRARHGRRARRRGSPSRRRARSRSCSARRRRARRTSDAGARRRGRARRGGAAAPARGGGRLAADRRVAQRALPRLSVARY